MIRGRCALVKVVGCAQMIERQTRAKAVMLDELLECAVRVAAKKAPKKPLTASSAAARWVACRILNGARPAVFTVDQPTETRARRANDHA
jgi:hypothetical protein